MFFRALTVVSVGTTDVMTMRELGQTVDAFFGNDDDTAAVAPVATIWATLLDVFLTAEAHATVSAATGDGFNFDAINKHDRRTGIQGYQ